MPSTPHPSPAPTSAPLSTPVWVVIMGVAGCGKSTIARHVADALVVAFIEGDLFHSPENVRKMTEGIALEDADREGWLDHLGRALHNQPQGAVLSCSALKRSYRDRLRHAVPDLYFVHLCISQGMANARVDARANQHLFPPSLVASQFAALEDPGGEDRVLQLDGAQAPTILTAQAIEWIAAQPHNILAMQASTPSTEN